MDQSGSELFNMVQIVQNCKKFQHGLKTSDVVQTGPIWSEINQNGLTGPDESRMSKMVQNGLK